MSDNDNKISAAVSSVTDRINVILQNKSHIIVAIDGRCAAGKSTFANALKEKLNCNVIHMDDFFLRPEQRTAQRLATAGENIDHERFLSQVLLPLSKYEVCSYRAYDCHTQTFRSPVSVSPTAVTIVEGSYCCHPALFDYYDIRIFLDIDSKEQMNRIVMRNGEAAAQQFKKTWIPLEEKYFSAFDVENRCDMTLEL